MRIPEIHQRFFSWVPCAWVFFHLVRQDPRFDSSGRYQKTEKIILGDINMESKFDTEMVDALAAAEEGNGISTVGEVEETEEECNRSFAKGLREEDVKWDKENGGVGISQQLSSILDNTFEGVQTVKNVSQDKVTLTKNTKGYSWEISAHADSLNECIDQVIAADKRLKDLYGGVQA
jgi:hypothetical protein